MSQAQSIPRIDSSIRVKQDEDIEKQDLSKSTEPTPSGLPTAGYPSAGTATGIPSEGRQRTYTGSTFTQSKCKYVTSIHNSIIPSSFPVDEKRSLPY